MAISAKFYKFDKRINSTKRPTNSNTHINLTVELKDTTNLFTPALVISADVFMSGSIITNPMQYTYCYIADFNRYYFIRSWSWILGRWECSLEVDTLASFKTEIGNSTCFVLRSSAQANGDIVDTKYPTVVRDLNGVKQWSTSVHPWSTDLHTATLAKGFYRISIANYDSSAVGGVSHYAMAPSAMNNFMNKLFSAPTWMGNTDTSISQDLQKMLINPMQYITSIMWIPYGLSNYSAGLITTIPFGWWSVPITDFAFRIDTSNCVLTVPTINFPSPAHPQYDASKRRWVHLSPYTTGAVYIPPFGYIPLDMSKVYDCDAIQASMRIDVMTGRGTLYLTAVKTVGGVTTDAGVIYTDVAQVGVPMTITQMALDWSTLTGTSTWTASAGAALADGALQAVSNAGNGNGGLLSTVKNAWNNLTDWGAGKLADIGGRLGLLSSADVTRVHEATDTGAQAVTSLAGSVKSKAASIGSTALAASGTCKTSGSSGGFAALQEQFYVQYFYEMITGVDDTHNGYPLCAAVLIKNLSGFILCGNTDDFTAGCTATERQVICGLMEAGFYYE